jgi:hypothetical protein
MGVLGTADLANLSSGVEGPLGSGLPLLPKRWLSSLLLP